MKNELEIGGSMILFLAYAWGVPILTFLFLLFDWFFLGGCDEE